MVDQTKEPRKSEGNQLDELRAFDRQQHIQKGLEAGLSREEAEHHADEDMKDRDREGADARP